MILPGVLYYSENQPKPEIIHHIIEFLKYGGFDISLETLPLPDLVKMCHGCCNPTDIVIYVDSDDKVWSGYGAIYGIMKEWNKEQRMWT